MVSNFDVRHGAIKSGHLDHPLQSYDQIYFNIFYEKQVFFGSQPARSKRKIFSLMICIGIFLAFGRNAGTPSKKCFFLKMWFFGDLGFPSVILVDKPLKALCLSFKMAYQHSLYLLSLWTYSKLSSNPLATKGQTECGDYIKKLWIRKVVVTVWQRASSDISWLLFVQNRVCFVLR